MRASERRFIMSNVRHLECAVGVAASPDYDVPFFGADRLTGWIDVPDDGYK